MEVHMSHEVNTKMMESIADEVWNSYYESAKVTREIDYEFVGDDGYTAEGFITYDAIYKDKAYKVLPNTLKANFDELQTANGLARLDEEMCQEQIEMDSEALEYCQDDVNEFLKEDRFMSLFNQIDLETAGNSHDDICGIIAEREIANWAEVSA
jgi:hypothetical protein